MALAGGGSTQIILTSQDATDSGTGTSFSSYGMSGGDVSLARAWGSSGVVESITSPSSAYTLFEVQAVVASGTSPSGSAVSSWLDLNAVSPQWYHSRSTAGTTACQLQVEVREKLNTSNTKTVTVILSATVS